MIITHKIKKESISRSIFNSVERNLSIFLLNRRGSYFSIPAVSTDNITNFNGWYNLSDCNPGYTLYKSIDNIYIDKSVSEITNNFTNVERVHNDTVERFALSRNGLIYEVDAYNDYVHVDLDFRPMFDTDDRGRIYSIYRHDDLIIVEYTKYTDNSLKNIHMKSYLAIKGADTYELVDKWTHKTYAYDMERKNSADFYVYNAMKISCRKNIRLYFSFSESKDEAIRKVDDVFMESQKIDEANTDYENNVLAVKGGIINITGPEAAFAYAGCVHAIDNLSMQLSVDHKRITGMWAGLPWFFQYWSRDELVSVMAPMLEHRYDFSKELLMKYLSEIMADGRLSNRYPTANLGTADSIGWLFKRLQDFLFLCERRNNFHNYFSLYDLNFIRERLKFSIQALLKAHSRDGLIINERQETWIDTFRPDSDDKDYREGARIEIQALFLNMLKLMNMMNNYLANKFVKKNDKLVSVVSDDLDTEHMEKEFKKLVRERFFKSIDGKSFLNDGYNCPMDSVIRPNLFLAYYIYPELLSSKEWTDAFDNALPKLWCDWDFGEGIIGGGLSTIDKTHPLYMPYYTGIDNKSYHRGDSWFWINNMAAISMYRLDKERYKDNIFKILNSSSQDILYWGFIGYSSELASSGWFKSGGCLCQTWSIATFIELIHEVYIE